MVAALAPLLQARGAAFARAPQVSPGSSGTAIVASARVPVPAQNSVASADTPRFSDPPTEQELLVSGVLPQPLAPVGGKPSANENRALGQALTKYLRSQESGALRDDVAPLTDFVEAHPLSPWRAALLMNLGIIYRQTGHMSKAMQAWQQAWDLSKNATGVRARAIADYSVGELAEFQAYLGRMETLAPLLKEVKGRPLHGTGAENISNASQGLAEMRTHPEDAFRCGPMALHRICMIEGKMDKAAQLEATRSTTRGTSLNQVAGWSRQVGLDFQMAFRKPGAPVIVPAVMHWKVGHFAAIVKTTGGRYQVEDPTFGENILVSEATIDDEASGYFAVPPGTLPKGWRSVKPSEGQRVWGRGFTSAQDPNGTSPGDVQALPPACPDAGSPGSPAPGGIPLTTANIQAMEVGLTLHDTPVSYQASKGPMVAFELLYSHRDALQPAIFTYTNFGPKWTSNWISYFTDNGGTINLYMPGGGGEAYSSGNGVNYGPGVDDQASVTRLTSSGATTGFKRELSDGSVQIFGRKVGTNQYFLTSVGDPQGNVVTLAYDGYNRITTLTDAAGLKTTLAYSQPGDGYKVTRVTDPFGRFASFTYNADGELASITDQLGLTSSYSYLYGSGDFVYKLTTPYGVTTFTYGDSTTNYYLDTARFVTITDPLGQTERVEYRQGAPGIADADPVNTLPAGVSLTNQYLEDRNTFVWDKHQYPLANLGAGNLDYTKATIYHFLHTPNFSITSRVLESVKRPLENRVWFNYPGQGNPIAIGSSNQQSVIGRVLDDGTTQLIRVQRNALSQPTEITDPSGRRITITYAANNIDPITIANTTGGVNQILARTTYNGQHEPLTLTDASGQVSKFIYNAAGQMTSATDPFNKVTTYTYGPTGLLLSVTRPLAGAVTTFTYDTANRVSSATDVQGYKRLFTYDAGDRLTKITYPDSTTQLYAYKLLDMMSSTDRLKHVTQYAHDALGRLTQVTDALGRVTRYGYCDCGALSSLTDPKGNKTIWTYDLEERLITKTFANNTSQTVTYQKSISRVANVRDALGQVANFSYYVDNLLKGISYTGAINPTPAASFIWDAAYPRVVRMNDGSGSTIWTYNPITATPAPGAGLLRSVTGPRGDIVSYDYDALGRAIKSTLNGQVEEVGFDAIGRVVSDKSPLDIFTIGYLGATQLPASVTAANGGLNTVYTYFPNLQDVRLQSITSTAHNGTAISKFQYAYNADGQVTSTVTTRQLAAPITATMTYDAARQLLGVTSSAGGTNYAYTYDTAGNRASQKVGAVVTNYTYNNVNELTAPAPAAYNANGEPLTLGTSAFKWDAAHRLISAVTGTKTTNIIYDGLGRRSRITQLSGTTVVSDKSYFWCQEVLCIERDVLHGGAITKRYLPEGLVDNGTASYYSLDNLGSVRELVDSAGQIQASYTYQPYGVRTKLFGAMESDWGFAGLFHDLPSGVDLAVYRAYNASLGRWQNRDPIEEAGGPNLYAYVSNNPLSTADAYGLFDVWNNWLVEAVTSPGFVNFSAGVGDAALATVSFGFIKGEWFRPPETVNKCSGGYIGGRILGTVATIAAYVSTAIPRTLIHFTTQAGAAGIRASGQVLPSTGLTLFGRGVYATTGGGLWGRLFVPSASTIPITLSGQGFIRIIPGSVYLSGGSLQTWLILSGYGAFANRDAVLTAIYGND